jgi:hypothetical protein
MSDKIALSPQAITLEYWAPMSDSVTSLVVVENPGGGPMTRRRYCSLLESEIQRLLDEAGPQQAKRLLEDSVSWLPDMSEILMCVNQEDWSSAIMRSDSMMAYLNQIKWEQTISTEEQDELSELYEDQCLEVLLSSLPT